MPRRPLPTIADVFRVTLNWHVGTRPRPAHNVMHFSAPGKNESDVFTIIDTNVHVAMFDWVSAAAVVDSVDIIKLDGSSGSHTHTTGSPAKWNGGGTGEIIPQVAGIIKLQTGLRGPSKRGRIFLPWVGEGEQSNGQLLDVSTVIGAWTTFANDCATAGAALGVASYKNADWNQAINLVGETTTATQRRRQRPVTH